MKKVLIISPYFAPSNTADMQRIRMSLPYFEANGWEAAIVTVHEKFSDTVKDELLLKSIPKSVKTHKVSALSKKWTSKIGLGSLGLRSLYFYKKYVDELLAREKYDLIYFSTTEFTVSILGNYWKKKFGTKYVIDMQDPWHSTYYQDKPKAERPKKYWFSYRLHKYLEPIAMKNVDGLISVSSIYVDNLKSRYPIIRDIPSATITFGAFNDDLKIAAAHPPLVKPPFADDGSHINIVYIGRAGYDMQKAINLLFESFSTCLKAERKTFEKIRFFFIGTSYASKGNGTETVMPLALAKEISAYVTEYTDRIGFYDSLNYLQKADALFIPGSDDPKYTASKIYPYLLAGKPLLAIFNEKSSATAILKECNAGTIVPLQSDQHTASLIVNFLKSVANRSHQPTELNWIAFEQYTASAMTKKQCELFNEVIALYEN